MTYTHIVTEGKTKLKYEDVDNQILILSSEVYNLRSRIDTLYILVGMLVISNLVLSGVIIWLIGK